MASPRARSAQVTSMRPAICSILGRPCRRPDRSIDSCLCLSMFIYVYYVYLSIPVCTTVLKVGLFVSLVSAQFVTIHLYYTLLPVAPTPTSRSSRTSITPPNHRLHRTRTSKRLCCPITILALPGVDYLIIYGGWVKLRGQRVEAPPGELVAHHCRYYYRRR